MLTYAAGTPIQNNVLELWGLFDFLMPSFLGDSAAFNSLYRYVSIRQHTSAYDSIRQHTSAYVCRSEAVLGSGRLQLPLTYADVC
jgi:SNF2 family DNA or RNA helicase